MVVICIDPLRALLLRDRLLLLLPDVDGADVILRDLVQSYQNVSLTDQHEDFAFEFKALEAILETVVDLVDQHYHHVEPLVNQSLLHLETEISGLRALNFPIRSFMRIFAFYSYFW